MNSFDYFLFQQFNSFAGVNTVLDTLIIFSGVYLIFGVVGAALIIIWRAKHARRLWCTFSVIASVFIGEASVLMLRFLYNQPRPFELLNLPNQLLYHSAGNAFPSGHAVAAFAIATAVFLWDRKSGTALYAVAFLVGISRIIGGIHRPTDVIAGMLVGSLSAFIVRAVARHIENR